MSEFDIENNYTPSSVEEIIDFVREGINTEFGTSYTTETFLGTNWYKYFYQIAQRFVVNETKTAEIFQKLSLYISIINERINHPATSSEGLIAKLAEAGYTTTSIKPMIETDRGKLHLCVDVDDTDPEYDDIKEEICQIISDYTCAGVVSIGTESEDITISNGQQFTYAFNLPDKTVTLLRVTITVSDNTNIAVPSDEDIRNAIFLNIANRYRLGWDFEPQKYYTIGDAPWASEILVEYSIDDGSNWETEIFEAEYDEFLEIALEDITLVFT